MRKDNRTEKTVKKKKRRKKHYLLRLLIIAAVCVGLYFLAHIEYFNVDNVVVTGNREISDEEIIKLSGIKTGGNLFDVHPLIAQHKIKKNLYIEDVDVDRKLPNTVEINISERSGKAQFVKGRKYCVTDNDGKVLEIDVYKRQLILSPGVSPELSFIKEAQAAGAEITGELEIAYRVGHGNYVAITGTNGKTCLLYTSRCV